LNHPNIVQVYDIGEDKGVHFFAMELVDGESLMSRLKRDGRIPLAEALGITAQVARALHNAHQHSIIHRDIKPDNILLTRSGQVKLADLGLAKSTKEEKGLTQTGAGMGTPYYMAPEQAEDSRSADHRADIYALGITLLHLLTGKRPYDGESAYSIILGHATRALPTGAQLGVALPEPVEALIQKMCAKKREERHQDYPSLLAEMDRLISRDAAAVSVPGTPSPRAGADPEPLRSARTVPAAGPRERGGRTVKQAAVIGAVAVVLVLTGIGLTYLPRSRRAGKPRKPPQTVSSTSSTSVRAGTSPETPKVAATVPTTVPKPENPRPGETVGPLGELEPDFEIPTADKDLYANPVRKGTAEKTGWPLEIRHKATGMHLVFIPPGEFMMGSPNNEKDRLPWEGPVHPVKITKPFYMGKYEVTQAEWQKVIGSNPDPSKAEANPVGHVSWRDAQVFVMLLNKLLLGDRRGAHSQGTEPAEEGRASLHFALPTEAQWEYACRAGTTTRFSFGDDPGYRDLGTYAWCASNADGKAHAVGQKKPNPWGLYDMHGSFLEWCQDWHGESYDAGVVSDPTGPGDGDRRVLRGGAFRPNDSDCRSAWRGRNYPNVAAVFIGARVVLDMGPAE
jgi:formylglycine-generating enzyme required for sulfatase activity